MLLEELQEAGRQLIEAGIQKWRDDGQTVYVPKVDEDSPDNVHSFKVNLSHSLF
jgi:hypothetical protein